MLYSQHLYSSYESLVSSTVKEVHPTMWGFIEFPFAQTDPSDQPDSLKTQEAERQLQAISAQFRAVPDSSDSETLQPFVDELRRLESASVGGQIGFTQRQEVRLYCLFAMAYDRMQLCNPASRYAAQCVARIEAAEALSTSSEKLRVHLFRAHLALKCDQHLMAIGSYNRIIALLISEIVAGTIFTDDDPQWLLGYAYLESAKAWAVLAEEDTSSLDARDAIGMLRQWAIDRQLMTHQQQLHLSDDQFVASFAGLLRDQRFVSTTDKDIAYVRLLVDYQRLLVFYLLWQYKLHRQILTVQLANSCVAAIELAIELGKQYDDRERQIQSYMLAGEVVLVFHERLGDVHDWLANAHEYLAKINGPDTHAKVNTPSWLALFTYRLQFHADESSAYTRLKDPVKDLAQHAVSKDKLHLAGCFYALLAHAQFREALVTPTADSLAQIEANVQRALNCFEMPDRRHELYSQHTRRQAKIYHGHV